MLLMVGIFLYSRDEWCPVTSCTVSEPGLGQGALTSWCHVLSLRTGISSAFCWLSLSAYDQQVTSVLLMAAHHWQQVALVPAEHGHHILPEIRSFSSEL